MRKRNDEKSIIKNFVFRTWLHQIPEAVFTEAQIINDVWNTLCEGRETLWLDKFQSLQANIKELAREVRETKSQEAKDKLAEARKWLRDLEFTFEQGLYQQLKTERENLDSMKREGIMTEFVAAHKLALQARCRKDCQTPCERHGHVHKKNFINNITIYNRPRKSIKIINDKGKAESKSSPLRVLDIFNGTVDVHIEEPQLFCYFTNEVADRKKRSVPFTLRLSSMRPETISGRVVLHREIPYTAKVKLVKLNGQKQSHGRGFLWQLILCLEIPANAVHEIEALKPACGLDVGYRLIGDYLRVGVITDTNGDKFELRLPLLDTATSKDRWNERSREKKGLPPLQMSATNYYDLIVMQQKLSALVEETKAELIRLNAQEAFAWTDEIQELFKDFDKVRDKGLIKMLNHLNQERWLSGPLVLIHDALTIWQEKSVPILLKRALLTERLLSRRDHAYKNIAAWLHENYSHVVWEGDLSLKHLAERGAELTLTVSPALYNARKNRQWAGLYKLRGAVQNKADGSNGWLVNAKAARTTIDCHICGAECEATAALFVTCANGHKEDQDVRAAENLLGKLPNDSLIGKNRVTVPEHLKKYIVPLIESH